MEQPKLNSRKIQAEVTKNKIYKSSIKLMEQQGFNNIKIEDICKKAGVSIGSFYNYFKSKNDILIEIYIKADEYFEKTVKNQLEGDNFPDKIVSFFEYYAIYNILTGFETVKQLFGPYNKMYITKGRKMQAVLIDIIEKGQESGQLTNEVSPEEMNDYLFVAARGVCYDWCARDGEYDLKDYMSSYFKRLINLFTTNNKVL